MTEPFRIMAMALTAIGVAVAFVYVLRIDAAELKPLLIALTGLAWLSFAVLGRAAARPPRIGALTERTFIAFTIAMLGSMSVLITTNTDLGRPWFDVPTASLIFRMSIIAVLAIPSGWLVLWFLGRLGEADR